jgi:hypothetical protein
MNTSTAAPAVPADVAAFAAEHGVADYVAPLLELARGLFPRGVEVSDGEDAEDFEVRFVQFLVDMTGMTVDELVAADRQWVDGLMRRCPPTHLRYFVLLPWGTA